MQRRLGKRPFRNSMPFRFCLKIQIPQELNDHGKLNRLFFQITNVGINPTRLVVPGHIFKQFSHSRGFANESRICVVYLEPIHVISGVFFLFSATKLDS